MIGALPLFAVVSVRSVLLRGLRWLAFHFFARISLSSLLSLHLLGYFRDRTRPDQTIHGNRCKGRSTLLAASGGIELVFRKVGPSASSCLCGFGLVFPPPSFLRSRTNPSPIPSSGSSISPSLIPILGSLGFFDLVFRFTLEGNGRLRARAG